MRRTLALTSAALATALTLAACGAGEDSATTGSSSPGASSSAEPTPAAGDFTDEDVTFAQLMLPHHAQAVEMSDLLLAKDDIDEGVVDLAEQIKAAQSPEITRMTGWMGGWDAEMPAMDGMGAGEQMDGMDGDGQMNGMMSTEDMQALEGATGAEASRLFLEQMTAHHEGAVVMAQAQVDGGTNPEAIELAETIIETQEGEIEQMRDLLAGL